MLLEGWYWLVTPSTIMRPLKRARLLPAQAPERGPPASVPGVPVGRGAKFLGAPPGGGWAGVGKWSAAFETVAEIAVHGWCPGALASGVLRDEQEAFPADGHWFQVF